MEYKKKKYQQQNNLFLQNIVSIKSRFFVYETSRFSCTYQIWTKIFPIKVWNMTFLQRFHCHKEKDNVRSPNQYSIDRNIENLQQLSQKYLITVFRSQLENSCVPREKQPYPDKHNIWNWPVTLTQFDSQEKTQKKESKELKHIKLNYLLKTVYHGCCSILRIDSENGLKEKLAITKNFICRKRGFSHGFEVLYMDP